MLAQRKRKSPSLSSVNEPEDDELSRQSSSSPDGKSKARPIAGGSPPKPAAAQASPPAPAAPPSSAPGSDVSVSGRRHDLLGALRECADDFCCLLSSTASASAAATDLAAQASAGDDSFLLRLAATLRPHPTGGSGATSGAQASTNEAVKQESSCASLASQLYQSVLLAGASTGSPVAVLACLARYLQAPEAVGRTRLLAAARLMQCLLSISKECREHAAASVFLGLDLTEGDAAAATSAQDESFASRCKGVLLPPLKTRQSEPSDDGALPGLPLAPLPGGGLSELLSTLLSRLVKELEAPAGAEAAATVHELLGILLTLAHETPPGDGPCGFWDGLLEAGALQEVLERALRARQVGVVSVCVEILQCLVQHQGLFHRLRVLRQGVFFSDISQRVLQWHVDPRWDEQARPAVDRLSLRVLRLLIGMVVKYGVAGRELIWSTGGGQQREAASSSSSSSAVHLIPSLIHVLNHEVMLLMATKGLAADDSSSSRAGRAIHLTLARETFELLTLVGLQQRDRNDALKDLIARSNVKWSLAAINFRLMNNMVDPSLSDLGEDAECWAETLEG